MTRRPRLGAPVPLTGRYAVQGRQMRAGLELWSARTASRLELVDDCSNPARAAAVHETLRERCEIVLGPYGSDSTRAVARAAAGSVVWNHGAAADDVQVLPGVVSLPTPASSYLVALGKAIARLRAGATVAVGRSSGKFASLASGALAGEASALGLELIATVKLDEVEAAIERAQPDAVVLCGPLQEEAAVLARLEPRVPDAILAGVSPGVAEFARVAGTELEGALAAVQWHPDAVGDVMLGPTVAELLDDADSAGGGELDYVAVQAYAAALVADACTCERPSDPLGAAHELRTRTVYGEFGIDPATGLQREHRLSVIRREHGQRRLHLADSS